MSAAHSPTVHGEEATEAEEAEIAAAGLTETYRAFPSDVVQALRKRKSLLAADVPLDASTEPLPMRIRQIG